MHDVLLEQRVHAVAVDEQVEDHEDRIERTSTVRQITMCRPETRVDQEQGGQQPVQVVDDADVDHEQNDQSESQFGGEGEELAHVLEQHPRLFAHIVKLNDRPRLFAGRRLLGDRPVGQWRWFEFDDLMLLWLAIWQHELWRYVFGVIEYMYILELVRLLYHTFGHQINGLDGLHIRVVHRSRHLQSRAAVRGYRWSPVQFIQLRIERGEFE